MTEKGFFQEIKDKSFLLISAVQSNLRNTDTEGTKQSVRTVLERCPYKRGHYDDVTFDSTYSFNCSVAKTRLTLVFKLHLN